MYQRTAQVIAYIFSGDNKVEATRILIPFNIHFWGWVANLTAFIVGYFVFKSYGIFVALVTMILPFLIGGKFKLPFNYFQVKIIKELVVRQERLSIVNDFKEKTEISRVLGGYAAQSKKMHEAKK